MPSLPEPAPARPLVRRVVLVEDQPEVRDGIAVVLEIEPDLKLVGTAASAEEALELIGRLAPDLVVLDNVLAGQLTGVEAAPAIKACAPGTVVMLCCSDLDQVTGREPGIDGYLCKDHLATLADEARQLLGSA